MYKKSKFNIYSLDGEKLIIYNTLSGGLISLKENYLEDLMTLTTMENAKIKN